MMLWDVSVSIMVDAQNNEEAMSIVESFLRRDGRNKDLDYNYLMHGVEDAKIDNLKELRKIQDERDRKQQSTNA